MGFLWLDGAEEGMGGVGGGCFGTILQSIDYLEDSSSKAYFQSAHSVVLRRGDHGVLGLTDDLVSFHPGLALALGRAVPGFVALAARGELLPWLGLGPAHRAYRGLVALEPTAGALAPEVEGLEEPRATQHPGQSRVDVGDENLDRGRKMSITTKQQQQTEI